MLYSVVLTFKSVDNILICSQTKAIVYYTVQSGSNF